MQSLISFNEAIPVDKMTGLRVLAIFLIKLKSLISKDEILNNFTFIFMRKSTALELNGVLNNSTFNFLLT